LLLLLVALAVAVFIAHVARPVRDGSTPAASDGPDRRLSLTLHKSVPIYTLISLLRSHYPVCSNVTLSPNELMDCVRQQVDPNFKRFDEQGFPNFEWRKTVDGPPLLMLILSDVMMG
jgi:hypothetical protein